MVIPGSPSLVEVLRSTLKQLEQNEDLATDDPALAELRTSILRTLAEIEVGKTPKSSAQQRILWITPRPAPNSRKAEGRTPEPAAELSGNGADAAASKTVAISSGKAPLRKPRHRASSGRG